MVLQSFSMTPLMDNFHNIFHPTGIKCALLPEVPSPSLPKITTWEKLREDSSDNEWAQHVLEHLPCRIVFIIKKQQPWFEEGVKSLSSLDSLRSISFLSWYWPTEPSLSRPLYLLNGFSTDYSPNLAHDLMAPWFDGSCRCLGCMCTNFLPITNFYEISI